MSPPGAERRGRLQRLLIGGWLAVGLLLPTAAPAAVASSTVTALRVRVEQPGLQRISAAALLDAGLPADSDPRRLQLWLGEAAIALELETAADDRLQPNDQLFFYAAQAGDRWNRDTVYRLMLQPIDGLRVSRQTVSRSEAVPAAAVIEAGSRQQPTIYRSLYAGADGDHWFSAELSGGGGLPAAQLPLTLTAQLPAADGTLTLTVSGTSPREGSYRLQATTPAAAAEVAWAGSGDWQQQLILPAGAAPITLSFSAADDDYRSVLIDQVSWQRSAQLNVPPDGARFRSAGQPALLQISAAPDSLRLYDVTDAQRPQRLSGWRNGWTDDGQREYLFASAAAAAVPRLEPISPVDWPDGADAVFLAPARLHAALAPLVTQRRAQGLQVAVIDVQAIYDQWSGGQIDPTAIRSFLQDAYQHWQPRPWAAVLVGDGSVDPHDYSGRNDRGVIPPFMAVVDPWLGETACENCFVQLDGASPLDDDIPEMAISRLPVRNAAQLSALVDKLIAYDQQPALDWRATQLYLSDNAFDADGTPDPAGDFFAQNEQIIALQPPGTRILRAYYDPRDIATPGHTGRAAELRAAALTAWRASAGIVVYSGHSNQWQWAVTDAGSAENYLLTLYDADTLQTDTGLPIVLALTCLSSAFQTPAYSGTTIDERLVLTPDGGAAAVWGSAGMGVVYGQQLLAEGFFTRLWDTAQPPARLGELTLAGYRALADEGDCCRDALRSAVLLGDATMPVRVTSAEWLLVPWVVR